MFLFVCPTHSPDLPVLPRPERSAAGDEQVHHSTCNSRISLTLAAAKLQSSRAAASCGRRERVEGGTRGGGLLYLQPVPGIACKFTGELHFYSALILALRSYCIFDHSVLVYYYVHIVIIYLMPTFLGFVLFVSSDKNVSARSSLVPSSV